LFGDGLFGKKLENNQKVTATYIVTDGKDGNGPSEFSFQGIGIANNINVVLQDISGGSGNLNIEIE